MRTFAEKPKRTEPAKSPKAIVRARSHFGHSHQENSILYPLRTIGNHAVQRSLLSNAEELNIDLTGANPPRFGHDFSSIPMSPRSSAALQTKLVVNSPGGAYELEADRAATSLDGGGDHADKVSSLSSGASSKPMSAPPIVEQALNTPGVGLDVSTRATMEAHFGHRFDNVRVHTDVKAAEAARSVDALAYTVGQHVVFGAGQYAPSTNTGKKLLAHELAHVVQQGHATTVTPTVQRTTYFGPTSGAPANWPTQVTAATTSAAKATLVQTATGMTVHDATSASSSDVSPTPAHLVPYTSTNQRINYDDNLNSKRSPVDSRQLTYNAGYTLHSSGQHYVILGPQSLDGDRYYLTLSILNHEFDHIRQDIAGSTLRGNESELDAWTTSFIRDFHRTYLLGDTGSTCYVHAINTWTPLLDYYHRRDVSTAQRDQCVRRLSTYYTSTISTHAGHLAAFRYWVYRSMRRSITPSLADRLNTDLSLGLSTSASAASIRQFPCGTIATLTYQAPTLARPTFPSTTP